METPTKGFYYHYKHDDQISVNNYAYEVLGVALHTEDRTYTVIYRPLYENKFLEGADFCARPLSMFLESVTKNDVTTPRFTLITDSAILAELAKIKSLMYPN